MLLLVAQRHGAGLSPDSIDYLSTGQHIADGRGVVTFDGSALTPFPPGLSALIAVGDWLGLSGTATAALINFAAIAVTLAGVFVLFRRRVCDPVLRWAGLLLVALSPALFDTLRFVGSDPLFVAVVVVWLCAVDSESMRRDMGFRAVGGLALLSAFGFMIRYAGFTLIATGAIVILLRGWRLSRRAAVAKAAAFTLLAVAAPAIWLARNHVKDGTLMGLRPPSDLSLLEILRRTVSTFGSWVLPLNPGNLTLAAAGFTVVAAVALLAFAHRRGRARPFAAVVWAASLTDPLVVFFVVYVGYLVVAQWRTAFDPVGTRLMSPAFVPSVVLMVAWLETFVDQLRSSRRSRRALLIAAAIFVAGHGAVSLAKSAEMARTGNGLAQVSFRNGPLSTAVMALPSDSVLISNEARAVWSLRRSDDVYDLPQRDFYSSAPDYDAALDRVVQLALCSTQPVYLVLFDSATTDLNSVALTDALAWTTTETNAQGSLLSVTAAARSSVACRHP